MVEHREKVAKYAMLVSKIGVFTGDFIVRRRVIDDLVKWKNGKNRKPLVLKGARQVGKTWLMKHFGEEFYQNYVL